MAIADDDLGELIRELDTTGDETRPDRSRSNGAAAADREQATSKVRGRRWVQVTAAVAAATILAIGGIVVWDPGGEPTAAAIVREGVEALDEFATYEVSGEEHAANWQIDTWSIRVSGDDAFFFNRSIGGTGKESVVTYHDGFVYTTADGQTEVRPRTAADRIETRYDELAAAVLAALEGAEVTEATTSTFGGVEMVRYLVGLSERSIASLSNGGNGSLIDDPENIEELRVCIADGEYMHEVHFIYRDGRTIDASFSISEDITIKAPEGPYVESATA
jgi:hypothetical protein